MNTETNNNSVAIGIDLGTTFCCNAYYRNNRVEIIPTNTGGRTTPSYISFTDTDIMIGESAKNNVGNNPFNTVYDVKRMMGRSYDDKILQNDFKHFSFSVKKDEKTGRPIIPVQYMNQEKQYFPEQLSSLLLAQLKKDAEEYLGVPVHKAVITVPAYFNNAQRQATKDAGEIAGLEVLRIINEPTSASIAYGINICDNDKSTSRNVVVYDLGGGTLDVSILNIKDGVFEVISTNGDTHLGGEDFDSKLVQFGIKEYARINNLDKDTIGEILKDARALRRLRTVCETAKRTLSTSLSTFIQVDSFFKGNDLNIRVTRAKFEELATDLFERCTIPLRNAIDDSHLTIDQIDDIIMIGGSTRIPKIRDLVKDFFNGKQLRVDINPDEAIASGAAIQAAILSGQMDNTLDGLILVDVTPLSLGIEAENGKMSVIIDRNSTVPCSKTKIYSTYIDCQRTVNIKVYEGERALVKDNTILGTFELLDLPPMPRKVPRIKVTFDIDVNGILHVTAVEETTGKLKKISIKRDSNRFDNDTLTKMIEDANKYKSFDTAIQATLLARNDLEKYLYSANSTLKNIKIDNQTEEVLADINSAQGMLSDVMAWFEVNTSANAVAFKDKHAFIESSLTPLICKLLSIQSKQKDIEKVVVEKKEPETLQSPEESPEPTHEQPEPVSNIDEKKSSEPCATVEEAPKKRGRKPKKVEDKVAETEPKVVKKRGRKPKNDQTATSNEIQLT
jgi:L1 cell adhesion molecule like protein